MSKKSDTKKKAKVAKPSDRSAELIAKKPKKKTKTAKGKKAGK